MAFPSLKQIESSPLSLFVFGPGFGEALLLRTPEGKWVAVDSTTKQCSGRTINPTLAALDHYGGELDMVLLTHPHEDHVKGLRELIERCSSNASIAAVEPLMRAPSSYAIAEEEDDVAALCGGAAIAAHVAIDQAWAGGRRKWTLAAESSIEVGGCSLEVLAPGAAALAEFAKGAKLDLNDLSAALRVKWSSDGDLVLGADVTAIAWEDVNSRLSPENLLNCRPVKVPHHGSRHAIHALLFDDQNPKPGRPLVATPWSRGTGLPRFEPGEGVDSILRTADSLYLTSFPFAPLDGSKPLAVSAVLESLRTITVDDDANADALSVQLDQMSAVESDAGVLDAWVLIQAGASGEFTIERGTSSLEVVP